MPPPTPLHGGGGVPPPPAHPTSTLPGPARRHSQVVMCLNSPTLPFLPCFITYCGTHFYTSYFYEIFATCIYMHTHYILLHHDLALATVTV